MDPETTGTHWYYYVDGDTIEELWQELTDLAKDDYDRMLEPLMDELVRIADTVNPW